MIDFKSLKKNISPPVEGKKIWFWSLEKNINKIIDVTSHQLFSFLLEGQRKKIWTN